LCEDNEEELAVRHAGRNRASYMWWISCRWISHT